MPFLAQTSQNLSSRPMEMYKNVVHNVDISTSCNISSGYINMLIGMQMKQRWKNSQINLKQYCAGLVS